MSYSSKKIQAVEGFDGVHVRTLNALELAEVADRVVELDKRPQVEQVKVMAYVCLVACCDDAGKALFQDEAGPLDETFAFLTVCMTAALDVNGLTEGNDPGNS